MMRRWIEKSMKLSLAGSVVLCLMLAVPASAKEKVVYKKRTVIDLSAAVIEGELTRPEGSYIVNRKSSRFSNLIQDRANFHLELLGSVNDL